MHQSALAAEVIANLAGEPGHIRAINDLAAACGETVAAVASACAMLERGGLLESTGEGAVCLPAGKQPTKRAVVLLVENTAAVAHLVTALLESEGYQVLIADTLGVGVRVARAISPDLVIADSFAATARDALHRLEGLREAAGRAPVLVFTAHRDLDEPRVQTAGYAGLLPKPFDIDGLLARVAIEIGERGRPPHTGIG